MSGCEKNVYEVTLERTGYIFSEFENIYLAFSGGKDSGGVMLNIVLDYMRRHGIKRKIGVLYMDVEASYKRTARFIERMYLDNLDLIEPYWVCLPMTTTNAVSMYEPYWIFWDPAKKDKWVRPMPEYDFIINKDNHPFDFYRENMTFEEFTPPLFGDWYARQHGNKKTACLIGIRADESLNRYHAVSRKDKLSYKDKSYSTRISDNTYNFYPICDWRTEDIWTYNGRYRKPITVSTICFIWRECLYPGCGYANLTGGMSKRRGG